MRLPDGREHIATLALPLPLDLLGALSGFTEAAAEVGWVDVVILTDGTNRVVARRAVPDPTEEDTRG